MLTVDFTNFLLLIWIQQYFHLLCKKRYVNSVLIIKQLDANALAASNWKLMKTTTKSLKVFGQMFNASSIAVKCIMKALRFFRLRNFYIVLSMNWLYSNCFHNTSSFIVAVHVSFWLFSTSVEIENFHFPKSNLKLSNRQKFQFPSNISISFGL